MPGTCDNKCTFRSCQYYIDQQTWQGAGLIDSDIKVSDDNYSEWGAERESGSGLNIWDEKPI